MITIVEGHGDARLEDLNTGEIHEFTGSRALFDALGVLADWRDRDKPPVPHCPVVSELCPGNEHGLPCVRPCHEFEQVHR